MANGIVTSRGVMLLAGGVLVWLAGRLLGVTELNIVALTCLALVGIGGLTVLLASARVSVSRSLSATRLDYGASAEVALRLRRSGRIPWALLLAEDACNVALVAEPGGTRFLVPCLGRGRTVSLRYRIVGAARGRHTIGPLQIRVQDPFGLTQRTRTHEACDQVLVYPLIERLPSGAIRGSHQGGGRRQDRRLFNLGDEFHTMREYVEGDDLRHVHWPSTAHRQKLMVRQLQVSYDERATIFLDTRVCAHSGGKRGAGPAPTLEKAVSAAASLAAHLAGHGFRLRLMTETDHRETPHCDLSALLDRLAELQPSTVPSLMPALEKVRGGDGLIAAIVPTSVHGGATAQGNPAEARALLRAARGYSGRLAIVVAPEIRDRGADVLAGMLGRAGWKTTTVAPGESLTSRWSHVAEPLRRGAAGAQRPSVGGDKAGGAARRAG